MNRQQFLKTMGMSGAAIFATLCLGSCARDEPQPRASDAEKVDFSLDLNADENSALRADGGYVVRNKVVVARTLSSDFVAVTQVCSHEGNPNVTYNRNTNEFVCSVHGARFDLAGKGLNSLGSRGLKVYNTQLNGNLLRVYEL